jgi:23S rRNA G2069 N7-methylase RlmK/C1962 C5-methylase RlmI
MTDMAMLANRVRRNARHLGKWARREGVTCWRVYDRDIPEIPITVDSYEGALVINDYRAFSRSETGGGDPDGSAGGAGGSAPRGIERSETGGGDPDGSAGGAGGSAPRGIERSETGGEDAWLDAAVAAVTSALPPGEVFVKRRERFAHRGAAQQYERQADQGAWRTVQEGGHAFRVNLSDYVDTGLFLDHRITRAKAAAEPARTMLNLFGYTGAFSVYAGAAGMQTTTVDLSNTYLAWAAENLALNRLTGELVHADVRDFLTGARRAGRRWDLVVVDPPTFSNSKRMDYTWDIERDHPALLRDVLAVCTGVVWFSTNRRRFQLKLDDPRDATRGGVNGPALPVQPPAGGKISPLLIDDPELAAADMTHATLPPDFRDRKVHHAYRITRR